MPPVNFIDTKRALLARAYAACKSTHVAFIDESYVIPKHADGRSFYYAAAYVAPMAAHEAIREDLIDLVGGTYWHTNEAHADVDRRPVIHEFCKYVGDGGSEEFTILAARTPIAEADIDGEMARVLCLNGLLSALHATVLPSINLAVVEERHHNKQRNRDEATVKDLRRSGAIGQMQVHFTTPTVEPLLWVPDVVAFAKSLETRGSDAGYIDLCAHTVRTMQGYRPKSVYGMVV